MRGDASAGLVTRAAILHPQVRKQKMEVLVKHLGNVKFSAAARGHHIVCDQPAENSGNDEGMTPPELLLASLGACAGFYAAQYLKTRSLSTEGLEVRVTAEKALHPARLGSF